MTGADEAAGADTFFSLLVGGGVHEDGMRDRWEDERISSGAQPLMTGSCRPSGFEVFLLPWPLLIRKTVGAYGERKAWNCGPDVCLSMSRVAKLDQALTVMDYPGYLVVLCVVDIFSEDIYDYLDGLHLVDR